MNKNLPHAVRVIRTALASTESDSAAAVAHALESVGLLVDPEKTFAAPQAAKQHPQRTELEEQALAWDESCARARRIATVIQRHVGEHPAFQNLQVDGDRVLVALHIVNQSQWGEWRRYFGIRHDKETSLPYMVAGDGYRDGVRVSVVAYDLPEARAHAKRTAKAPFEFEGIVYDLALPQRDSHGNVWFFQGQRTDDGMPLLSIDGRPERCSLPNLVAQAAPLTPVTNPATPVTAPQGGESA